MKIAIGERISNVIQAKKASKAALSRALGVYPSSVERRLKLDSVQVSVLAEYAVHLQHNFFADLAARLPTDYTTDAPQDTTKDETIAQLKRRIEILEAQVEVLRK